MLVVSPTKKGPGGVDALNARLHERLRPSGAPAHDIKGFNAQYYTIGDPVMWLRNDYSRGLFNGQIGQVQSIPDSPGERWLEVLFDGESSPRTLQLEDLMDLTLAHAITCHKLQGSQAARVVVPIYESRVLDPSWVYTAITRAERQVILVGDLTVLRLALRRPGLPKIGGSDSHGHFVHRIRHQRIVIVSWWKHWRQTSTPPAGDLDVQDQGEIGQAGGLRSLWGEQSAEADHHLSGPAHRAGQAGGKGNFRRQRSRL